MSTAFLSFPFSFHLLLFHFIYLFSFYYSTLLFLNDYLKIEANNHFSPVDTKIACIIYLFTFLGVRGRETQEELQYTIVVLLNN